MRAEAGLIPWSCRGHTKSPSPRMARRRPGIVQLGTRPSGAVSLGRTQVKGKKAGRKWPPPKASVPAAPAREEQTPRSSNLGQNHRAARVFAPGERWCRRSRCVVQTPRAPSLKGRTSAARLRSPAGRSRAPPGPPGPAPGNRATGADRRPRRNPFEICDIAGSRACPPKTSVLF